MAASKIERLEKAVSALETALKANEIILTNKKNIISDKERNACTEIRSIIVANDFNALYKVDRRYGDLVAKGVEMIFRMVNHVDQDIRTYAEESIDAVLRSLLLGFYHSRVLVLLITEIGRNTTARSVVCALRRLAHLIHFSKCNRVVSYGLHIISALTALLRRPEEIIQNAVISYCGLLFDTLGPRLRSQHTEKAFDLYCAAADNLELNGTANRAAVTVIAQLATYYPSIMNKAFLRCMVNVRDADDNSNRTRLIGSLNTLKSIWPILSEPGCTVAQSSIKTVMCSVLCCLSSGFSEVVVASIELLDKIMSDPLPWFKDFLPLQFELASSFRSKLASLDIPSRTISPLPEGDPSLPPSSLGSMLDVSESATGICDFTVPLVLPESSGGRSTAASSSPTVEDEIIDPLIHADLYEEVNKGENSVFDTASTSQPSCSNDSSLGILKHLPLDVCDISANCFVVTAAMLSRRFLLAGLKGLRNDRDIRISHKILALNCVTTISKHQDLSRATLMFDDFEQSITEVSRFILHDDDQLCASTVAFLFSLDKNESGAPDNSHNYRRVMRAFQPIRKRSLLQAAIGQQHILDALGILPEAIHLAATEVSSTFFLLKVTCAEFLSTLKWNMIESSIKEEWQSQCLIAYFDLLFSEDFKVAQAALGWLDQLVINADFTEYTGIFGSRIPDDLISLGKNVLPVVLNMPSHYRFRGECQDFVVDSNLEEILGELMEYFSSDVLRRSSGFCFTLEALLKAFPASLFSECWGCLSKQSSSACGLLSTVLELCELHLNTAHKLSSGLRVVAALFAAYCESHMMSVVQEQATIDRLTLPRLPDQVLLDRLLLLPLRVLNMYYSLIAEYRSVMSQASTSILSRPTLSPLPKKEISPSRIADISRLLGTSIHPTLQTSYLECPTLKQIFHSVAGAHRNFLERLDNDCESRFVLLLRAGLECLGTICEMLTFSQIRPLLQEILLYVKITFEVCPDGCTTLLHQLFKVVFGKNTANINLDVLQSMKMKDPIPPLNEAEMLYLRYANEFTLFSAFVNRKEYIDTFILRNLGWLKNDMLAKIHNPPPNEIAPALELFEGFVTVLLQVYGSFQSVSCKRAILGVMCELPRDGIIYAMADPKKALFEAVTTQLYDPASGNKELLTEIALYLIVLARTTVIKYDQVSRVAVELIEKTNQNNVSEVLRAVETILMEILFVQRSDACAIYTAFRQKSKVLFGMNSQCTLKLWTLFLHSSRNDENRWSSFSIDFLAAYSDFASDCNELVFTHSVYAVVTAFACMTPAMYRPVDSIFQQFRSSLDNNSSLNLKLKRSVPVLFSIFNNVAEEKLLMRMEQMIEYPLEWLVRNISELLLLASTAEVCSDASLLEYSLFLFQSAVNLFKAGSYPKLCSALQSRLKDVDSVRLYYLAVTQPSLLSQWLQLLFLCNTSLDAYITSFQSKEYVMRLIASFSPVSKNLESENSPADSSPILPCALPKKCAFVEFCKAVFSGLLWFKNPRVFRTLLSLEPPDIYYVYECVPESGRECFMEHIVNSMSVALISQSVYPDSYKTAVARSQEILDVIYDLIEFEGEANRDALRLKLFVLSRLPILAGHDLAWGDFRSNELVALLEFAAEELAKPGCNMRATCDGLVFLLEHKSTTEIFARDIFYGIQSIRRILQTIYALLGGKDHSTLDHSTVSDKIVVSASNNASCSSDFEDFGGLDGFISTLFSDIHAICHIFRSQVQKDSQHFEKFCRVLLRHPVLHRLAIVPYTALKLVSSQALSYYVHEHRMNWKLRVDVRDNIIHVPLVNIHLLCNLDILSDFIWRLNWLGWISRQQFEDFWMSLFGVLSSTPTGSELVVENSANLSEQILASSLAVSVLTDILIYSLLYPHPGNPPSGRFIIKHRERTEPFYQSKSMQILSILKARLTHDRDPVQVYRRNLERLCYEGTGYGFGQLSALSLWTLTGVLNEENPQRVDKQDSPRMRISLSEYLLKMTCELDTASSVRALFENYSHWLARGVEHLPLPLLSSTVKSMALLSDLFDESSSYEFLYVQMRNIFRGGFLAGHPDVGYVIYSLLKAVTVIGLEQASKGMTEADLAKQILSWVESGLTSWSTFVREATLHGFVYLMQSMTLDPLKAVVQYVTSFLLEEIKKQLSVTDPINVIDIPASLEYSNLLWSVSFRIMEEPLQVTFKNTLIQRTCETFSVMNLSSYLLPVVTSGIEALVLHSTNYIPQFLQLAHECLKSYGTMSSTFPYALRIFIACVFKQEADPRRASAMKFEPVLDELYNVYRRCDEKAASMISIVLPSVLLRLYPEERVLNILLDFCIHSKSASQPDHIVHSLSMVFEFFERMRDNQRLSSLMTFAQLVVSRLQAKPPTSLRDRTIATCLLSAVSSYEEIANRFHVYLASLQSCDASEEAYEFLLQNAIEECSSTC